MTETYPAVSGTGHRPWTPRRWGLNPVQLACARERCRAALTWLATERGTTEVWSGMANGFDLALAACAVDVGLRLIAHIPYEAQPLGWPAKDQQEWSRLRALAADEVLYSDRPPMDHDEAWQHLKARNEGLLQAPFLIGCWDPTRRKGGTWSAIARAQKLGRPGVLLDPVARTTRMVPPGGWF